MPKRVVESHQEGYFENLQNARFYAKKVEHAAQRRFGGFLKIFNALNIKGNCLEIGTGSGILATMLVANNPDIKITATDSSEIMLNIARDYITEKNLNNQIQLIRGDVEEKNFQEKKSHTKTCA